MRKGHGLTQTAARWPGLLLVLALSLGATPPTPALRDGRPPLYATTLVSGIEREHAIYRMTWLGAPAAEAEWTVTRHLENDEPILVTGATVRTASWVDPLWRLRSRLAATLAADPIRPQEFLLRTEDGKYDREVVRFDHERGTVVHAQLGGNKPHEAEVSLAGQYDPVSASFALRGLPLRDGDTARIEVQAPEDLYRIDVRVLGRERVHVAAGDFDAIALEPTVWNVTRRRTPRGFTSARLWVSDDPRRLPLLLTSEVFIGSVHVELAAIR